MLPVTGGPDLEPPGPPQPSGTFEAIAMTLHLETIGGLTVVRPPGPSLDGMTARRFRREFAEALPSEAHVILDLSEITFVDSTGCGAILACFRHLHPSGDGPGSMLLSVNSPEVRILFEIVKMHKVMTLCNDLDEALKACGAHRGRGLRNALETPAR